MPSEVSLPRMIGESASFLEMQEHVSQVAPLNKPVLIVGERGTGKELIASRLHYLSSRWQNNFLKINCAALSDALLEAQLFGHEAGAFTGATGQRKGLFERADGGTLFLDELANTAMPVQEKILRVIEYGEFERLGGNQTLKVDVRLVAATNEDLPALGRAGKFREDLIDRLAFDVVTLPPLRARKDDILVLAEHFAISMVKEMDEDFFAGFSDAVQRQLLSYSWPGNIRELKNVIERAVYQHPNKTVSRLVFNPFESPYRPSVSPVRETVETTAVSTSEDSVPAERVSGEDKAVVDWDGESLDFRQHIQDYETDLLRKALEHCQFNQRKTATHLNLSYHQLRGYLRKYDLLS
ncbi:phage shock protein operon transcriptional activator [Pseudohongiella acticola]|jgi:psp operon transcriptional activator|uniref:Phage shock protein operon transcriptional activator n=2 Tax=Pseudohongiella acticola TaxID=1524254 RepID=A0A1E8CIS9_9GAMM|nr:phage shock protein operon transcriptional activator [Pseudohongiella acticola]